VKILVLHSSAGGGHRKAAEAIFNYLRNNHKDAQVKIVDSLEYCSWLFRFSYHTGYTFLVNHATAIWGFLFGATSSAVSRKILRKPAVILNHINTVKFREFLIRENPDLIISTHFLSSEVSGILKSNGLINSKVVTVITDFGVHSFWLANGIDYYWVASEKTKDILIEEGIPDKSILVYGIPVDVKFEASFNKQLLRQKIGLDKNKFTVLLATGSFGIGPLEEITTALKDHAQIILVCARNKKLYKRMLRLNYPQVKVYAFVDNMEELMASSDIIITKPGGLSVSELLAMDLAPIFICAIPGQEEANARILMEQGIGFFAKTPQEAKEKTLEYIQNPQKLEQVRSNIRFFKKTNPLQNINNLINK
jgi:processive 1,2-diacylglycerol beta-glucosyltransferase